MNWEELLAQFRAKIKADIDAMEEADIAALQVILDNSELAVQRQTQLKTILGISEDSSEYRYLHRLRLPEALVAELKKIQKELGTEFSK